MNKVAELHFLPKPGEASLPIRLKKTATILGRGKADIIIADPLISATHAQIVTIGGEFYLLDMNSKNGTFLNSRKILKEKLTTGDVISLGSSLFLFVAEEEALFGKVAKFAEEFSKIEYRSQVAPLPTKIEAVLTYKTQTERYCCPSLSLVIGREGPFNLLKKIADREARRFVVLAPQKSFFIYSLVKEPFFVDGVTYRQKKLEEAEQIEFGRAQLSFYFT